MLAGMVLPLIVLLWPFMVCDPFWSTLLRVVSAISGQLLFYSIAKCRWVGLLPMILTAGLAGWGIFLYCTSEVWKDAALSGLLMDYVSPLLGCIAAWIGFTFIKKPEEN